jgi:hypothetical protein
MSKKCFSNLSPMKAPARQAGSAPKTRVRVWHIENKLSYYSFVNTPKKYFGFNSPIVFAKNYEGTA